MPRRDGTGPEGKGPKTGRAQGPCSDVETRGRGVTRNGGLGLGLGLGFGRKAKEADKK